MLCLDVERVLVNSFLTGIFVKHLHKGMLDVFDYESRDQTSSFLGATEERLCGNKCNLEETQIFTKYVKLLIFERRENTSPYLNKTDPVKFEDKVD